MVPGASSTRHVRFPLLGRGLCPSLPSALPFPAEASDRFKASIDSLVRSIGSLLADPFQLFFL